MKTPKHVNGPSFHGELLLCPDAPDDQMAAPMHLSVSNRQTQTRRMVLNLSLSLVLGILLTSAPAVVSKLVTLPPVVHSFSAPAFLCPATSGSHSWLQSRSRHWIYGQQHICGRSTRLYGRRSRKTQGGKTASSSDVSGKRSRRDRKSPNDFHNDSTTKQTSGASTSTPKSYKRSSLRIQADSSTRDASAGSKSMPKNYFDIVLIEIDDEEWWEAKTLLEEEADAGTETRKAADNPFGTKAWPSALAVAQLLAGWPSTELRGRRVIELGCGTGIASIAAAAMGANVLATDVSKLALRLTRQGWTETKEKAVKPAHSIEEKGATLGTLSTAIFDVTSNEALPISSDVVQHDVDDNSSSAGANLSPVVIATSVLYESDLAGAIAERIAEAAALGASVILADCDSGQREGGRQRFESSLARSLKAHYKCEWKENLEWKSTTAKCPELGWREKHVRLLQLNASPPSSVPATCTSM